jgi:hypothetical protein
MHNPPPVPSPPPRARSVPEDKAKQAGASQSQADASQLLLSQPEVSPHAAPRHSRLAGRASA